MLFLPHFLVLSSRSSTAPESVKGRLGAEIEYSGTSKAPPRMLRIVRDLIKKVESVANCFLSFVEFPLQFAIPSIFLIKSHTAQNVRGGAPFVVAEYLVLALSLPFTDSGAIEETRGEKQEDEKKITYEIKKVLMDGGYVCSIKKGKRGYDLLTIKRLTSSNFYQSPDHFFPNRLVNFFKCAVFDLFVRGIIYYCFLVAVYENTACSCNKKLLM